MDDSTFDSATLRENTFLREVEVHDSLDSTNNRALELARQVDAALPLLIVAKQQLAGRGRGNNSWWSSNGALTFSILFQPGAHGIEVSQWPKLSLTTAVALCDAVAEQIKVATLPSPTPTFGTPPLAIKWPNDVFLNSRKLAGILIESPGGTSPAKDRLAIGIGINVNNSWQGAPAEVRDKATSLFDAEGGHFKLQHILASLLKCFEYRLNQLARGDARLVDDWQRLSWLTGHDVEIRDALETSTIGTCRGIDADGAILVDTPNGMERVFSGTVTFL